MDNINVKTVVIRPHHTFKKKGLAQKVKNFVCLVQNHKIEKKNPYQVLMSLDDCVVSF